MNQKKGKKLFQNGKTTVCSEILWDMNKNCLQAFYYKNLYFDMEGCYCTTLVITNLLWERFYWPQMKLV